MLRRYLCLWPLMGARQRAPAHHGQGDFRPSALRHPWHGPPALSRSPDVVVFLLLLITLLLGFLFFSSGPAMAAVIDFEDIVTGGPGTPSITPVTNQYASLGVTFNSCDAMDYSKGLAIPDFAHSGTKAIEQCYSEEFCSSPIRISFTAAQSRVRVWIGFSAPLSTARTVVMTAYNILGDVVATDSTTLTVSASPIPIRQALETALLSAVIRRVDITFSPSTIYINSLAVDDVEFDTIGPPPPCPAAVNPTLSIVEPAAGDTVRCNRFLYRDQVASGDPDARRMMTITAPDGTSEFWVTSAASNMGPVWIYDMLKPGANTLEVRIEDCKGTITRTRVINYTPVPNGVVFHTLGYEVTQAIQDLNNTVTLIAGKRTVVRVYPQVTGPLATVSNVRATLHAHRPGINPLFQVGPEMAPYGVDSLNAITVNQSTDLAAKRASLNNTLNFELPPEWTTAGDVHFRVQFHVDDCLDSLACQDCGYEYVSDLLRYVSFEEAPPVRVRLVRVPYQMAVGTPVFTPRQTDLDHLVSWLRRGYPTHQVISSTVTTSTRTGRPDDDFDSGDVNNTLEDIRDMEVGNGWVSSRTHYYGLVDEGGDFMRGSADGIPSKVASGPSGSSNWGWDFDGSYADWYGAHELGHTFNRHHAVFCGAEACWTFLWWDICPGGYVEYPYPNGFIDGGSGRYWGFDLGDASLGINQTLYPPDQWKDLMTYCDREWVSNFTYEGILNRLRSENPTGDAPPDNRVELGRLALKVSGRMNLTAGTAILKPFWILPDLVLSERPSASVYDIALQDSRLSTLATYPFTPKVDTEWRTGEDKMAVIAEVVPWMVGTRRIAIRRDGDTIAFRLVTPSIPDVTVKAPNGGGSYNAGSLAVEWISKDVDEDLLTYAVHYSTDAGNTWQAIATDLTFGPLSVPVDEIPGSKAALIRVVATDGVNTTWDQSDATFAVRAKIPTAAIYGPANGSTFAGNQVVVFSGEGTDLEEGTLDGSRLEWVSSVQGVLGKGRMLSTRLRTGQHTITLIATDLSGAKGTASVVVTVGPAAPFADPGPDRVVGLGSTVALSCGNSSGAAPLGFQWELVERPNNSGAVLAGALSPNASFMADAPGRYVVQLIVTDAAGASAVARAVISSTTAVNALRIAGGLTASTSANMTLMNVETEGASASRIDILDALRLAWRSGFNDSGVGWVLRDATNRFLTFGVVLNDPRLNGRPEARLIASHRWMGHDNGTLGVYYEPGAGRWVLYNDDLTPMADGELFYYAFGPQVRAVTVAGPDPMYPWGVRLDDPAVNAIPNAVILANHNYVGAFNLSPLAMYYVPPTWFVLNEYGSTMPVAERFFYVEASGSGGRAVRNPSNDFEGVGLYLDDPRLNNQPFAIVFAQHNAQVFYNMAPLGVWYNTTNGRWVVYNEGREPMRPYEVVNYYIGQ